MTPTAIIAAGEARAALVATLPRTQLIRGVDMDEAITWGPERKHDGSAECPAEARDVPCSIFDYTIGAWLATTGCVKGHEWGDDAWKRAAAYRLPAVTAPPADPVRDALVEAVQEYKDRSDDYFSLATDRGGHSGPKGKAFIAMGEAYKAMTAALALAKGEKL